MKSRSLSSLRAAVAAVVGLFFVSGAALSQDLVIDGATVTDAATWTAAQQEGGFALYTSQSPVAIEALSKAFTADTGLEIEVVAATAARVYERVLSEAGAGVLNADVIWITDIALADGLAEANVWQKYEPTGFDKLAAEFKAANNGPYFIPLQAVNTLSYNTELVKEADAPRKWTDLLDPKWADRKLGITTISGGSNWARELWLRETYGLEYWQGIAKQKPVVTDSNGATTDLLARGEVAVGVALPANVAQAAKDGAPVKVIIPEDGMIAYNQYAGLASSAKKPNSAKVFLSWLLSPKGQKVIAVDLGNYPVMAGAPAPKVGDMELPKRGEGIVVQPSPEGLVKLRKEYQAEWLRLMGISG